MDITERQLAQCPLCRADFRTIDIPRANWPSPAEPILSDAPHPADAQKYFNYQDGVVRIPPLSPPAPRFTGTSGKSNRPSPAPVPGLLPPSLPEDSLLLNGNGLPVQPSPLIPGVEDDEDQHLQQQLRLVRQQA